jgi:dTDP-4-dehydrorhamnose 3,5-epimerase
MAAPHLAPDAIAGVGLRRIDTRLDHRGGLAEVYREEWAHGALAVQWNLVHSAGGVVRGVHVHPLHDDYVVVVDGRIVFGLRDLRRGSPSEGVTLSLEVKADEPYALTIPRGVAHGFCHLEPTTLLVGVNRGYDPVHDELEVHWQDPALGIEWPLDEAVLSDRDANAGTLSELLDRLEPWQPL